MELAEEKWETASKREAERGHQVGGEGWVRSARERGRGRRGGRGGRR